MLNTYTNGQVVLVRRRNLFSAPFKRDDVILFRRGRDVLIKRIHRLSGEELDEPRVTSFLKTSQAYDLSEYYEQKPSDSTEKKARLFVPEGYLVVLGDNAPASEDSRLFGPIPIRDVLGSVVGKTPASPTTTPLALPPTRRSRQQQFSPENMPSNAPENN